MRLEHSVLRGFVLPYLWLAFFFFLNDTATPEIYTLSPPDALPISRLRCARNVLLYAFVVAIPFHFLSPASPLLALILSVMDPLIIAASVAGLHAMSDELGSILRIGRAHV